MIRSELRVHKSTGYLPLGLKRSEVVRQALRQWRQRRATERFDEEWSTALGREPDDPERADDWLGVQSWGRK